MVSNYTFDRILCKWSSSHNIVIYIMRIYYSFFLNLGFITSILIIILSLCDIGVSHVVGQLDL